MPRLKPILVKVGSSVCSTGNRLRRAFFPRIAEDLACVRAAGKRPVVIVTSGAISAGSGVLRLSERPKELDLKAACSAIGQVELMREYSEAFRLHRVRVAQILVTASDFENRTHTRNLLSTIQALLSRGVIPIVNENDSVAVDEILYGDNDLLSASLAGLISAEILILLSSVSGLRGERSVIRRVRREVEVAPYIDPSRHRLGTGGARSKLEAAKRASHFKIPTVVASGARRFVVRDILAGRPIGTTLELASGDALNLTRYWLKFAGRTRGRLIIDDGACVAIRDRGASLLARGIIRTEGNFDRFAIVELISEDGAMVARGVSLYDAKSIELVRARPGRNRDHCVVHRDEMVIL